MTDYDLIVIGGGTGNNVASAAARQGLDVALVEKRALGGTCLTRGCNPSKTLVHRAKLVDDVRGSEEFGIEAELSGIDFSRIVAESTDPFDDRAEQMKEHVRETENLTLYETEVAFTDERTLTVDDEEIAGETIVIAVGARPVIPPIDGIEDVDYVTSDGILRLDERPDHLVVIGGGYVGAEMGYVYGALGSDVTVISRSELMLPRQDEDVREAFTERFAERFDVLRGYEATAVSENADGIAVEAESGDEERTEVRGDELLVAAGRRPNSDALDVEAAGIETDDDGFVEVDEHMETNVDDVWAIGDVVGNHMFWHSALAEAELVYRNALHERRDPIEYPGMAHAIFSSPEVASTGATEAELAERSREYEVGRAEYGDTTMGMAMKEDDGFVKVLADPDDGELLGCHIVGPDASVLIHEVTAATSAGSGTISDITGAIHVHPALNEVVEEAFGDVSS